eukprot:3734726-Lingulodinium_polyedra.AAC.1
MEYLGVSWRQPQEDSLVIPVGMRVECKDLRSSNHRPQPRPKLHLDLCRHHFALRERKPVLLLSTLRSLQYDVQGRRGGGPTGSLFRSPGTASAVSRMG